MPFPIYRTNVAVSCGDEKWRFFENVWRSDCDSALTAPVLEVGAVMSRHNWTIIIQRAETRLLGMHGQDNQCDTKNMFA